MPSILSLLQPQADAAAVSATNAALDQAAARPFNVVLSVDDATKAWISAMLIIGLVAGVVFKRRVLQ